MMIMVLLLILSHLIQVRVIFLWLCIEMIDEERIVRFIVQYVKINCKRQPEIEVI